MTPWTHGVRFLCPWDSPGKKTGVSCHALLQGIFPNQGLNPSLPHCSWILYHLSYQGSPRSYRRSYLPFSQTTMCHVFCLFIYNLFHCMLFTADKHQKIRQGFCRGHGMWDSQELRCVSGQLSLCIAGWPFLGPCYPSP